MDISFNELNYFSVWPIPETAMGVLHNCIVGASPQTIRDAIIAFVRSKCSPPHTNDL